VGEATTVIEPTSHHTYNRTASVQHYLQQSLSESTRQSYASALKRYQDYCLFRGWNPDRLPSLFEAEEFLAAMADMNEISSNSIHVYKAGLAWHYSMKSADTNNPFDHVRIKRLLKGVEKMKAKSEQEKRLARPRTESITMDTIRTLRDRLSDSHDDKTSLMLAAASLCAASACRPGEILGSDAHRDRTITMQQVRFYETATATTPINIPNEVDEQKTTPHHLTLTLNISKTNQLRKREEIHISSPVAVALNWRWLIHRQSVPHTGQELFRRDGYVPLRMKQLLSYLTHSLRTPHHTPFLTGKCFRIGGASTLAGAGASEEEISQLGRWRSRGMWRTYADYNAIKQRAIRTNRNM
jgi:hypothetical protein